MIYLLRTLHQVTSLIRLFFALKILWESNIMIFKIVYIE